MRLGLLELARTPGRFVLVAVPVSLLIGLVLAFSGIGTRHVEDLEGAVARSSADLLVMSAGAQGSLQASRLELDDVDTVGSVAGVSQAAPVGETRVGGRIGDALYDVSLWGAVPGAPGAPDVEQGRPALAPGEAVADVADAHLGLDIGDRLTVADTGHELEIVGLTRARRYASVPTVTTTYVHWAEIIDAMFPDADGATPAMVAIGLQEGASADEVAAATHAADDGLAPGTPEQLAAGLPGVAGVRASFASATVVALVSITAVTGLFFLLGVVHRRRALATLRAVGAPRRTLVAALLTQVVAIVGIGTVAGGILVAVAARLAPPRVPLVVSWPLFLVVGLGSLLAAGLAVLGVVRHLRRLDPAEALERRT